MPEEVYVADCGRVVARGLAFNQDEAEQALRGDVGRILEDHAGKLEVEELLSSVAKTKFQQEALARLLAVEVDLEPWRVGEAFAEAHLTLHHSCEFPWPGGRDLKNPRSSPGGCDLVGFQSDGSMRLAFGEAKTSRDSSTPPSVVTGRHGLAKQIEKLRDSESTKDPLVLYLAHHAPGKAWADKFQAAAARYLADPEDVAIYGVLVRDISPSDRDLSSRARRLDDGCPATTQISLVGIYLPVGSIPDLPQLAGGGS